MEIVLVEYVEWEGLTPARYNLKYLLHLRGPKIITVLFSDGEDDDVDDDNKDIVQDPDEENEGKRFTSDEDNRELSNRHDFSEKLDTEATKLQARADKLKREYARLLTDQDCTAKDFRCMDHRGTFY